MSGSDRDRVVVSFSGEAREFWQELRERWPKEEGFSDSDRLIQASRLIRERWNLALTKLEEATQHVQDDHPDEGALWAWWGGLVRQVHYQDHLDPDELRKELQKTVDRLVEDSRR